MIVRDKGYNEQYLYLNPWQLSKPAINRIREIFAYCIKQKLHAEGSIGLLYLLL